MPRRRCQGVKPCLPVEAHEARVRLVVHDAQVEAEEDDDGGERHRGVELQPCGALRQRVQTVSRRYAPRLQQGLEGQQRQLSLRELQEEEAACAEQ